MGFTEVKTLDAENTIALGGRNKKTGKNNPSSIEGYYLGSRQVESKKSKTGKAAIHFFQTPKGNVGVWGKTDLDRKLSAVEAGTMVRASFAKMVPTPNGEMYQYKVEVDASNTVDVSDLATGPTETNSDDDQETLSYSSNDDTSDDDDTTTEDDEDEDQQQAQALARLEAKNRVQALLNKGKAKGKTA